MVKITGFKDTIAWYNANASQYAKGIERVTNIELIDKFAEKVGFNGKVLDVGCAAGRDCRLFAERGLKVTGIDLSPQLIEIAKKNNPNLDFFVGNFLELPFKANSFDGIWAHASLLHLEKSEEVERALLEFKRVLKPLGILHVMVKQKLGDEKTSVVSDALSNHDRFFQWFTKYEIESLLVGAGFSIITLEDNYPDPAGREEVRWVYALAKSN